MPATGGVELDVGASDSSLDRHPAIECRADQRAAGSAAASIGALIDGSVELELLDDPSPDLAVGVEVAGATADEPRHPLGLELSALR